MRISDWSSDVCSSDDYVCIGLITVKDMETAQAYPHSCKDEQGRLRAAAAIGVGPDGLARDEALLDAGVAVIVVDTAHRPPQGVMGGVGRIKQIGRAAGREIGMQYV